jgi:hypothetical protein
MVPKVHAVANAASLSAVVGCQLARVPDAVQGIPRGRVRPIFESYPDLACTSLRIQFSAMLAVEREPQTYLVDAWRYFQEPLAENYPSDWADTGHGSGELVELTAAEVAVWAEWYARLNAPPVAQIEGKYSEVL